jgi:CRISPR/Cas system Type II protein with McrA/HNH and RuvC-like nuclease domain
MRKQTLNDTLNLKNLRVPTKEVADIIAEHIKLGMSIEGAVKMAGVYDINLFKVWYRLGVEIGDKVQSGIDDIFEQTDLHFVYLAYVVNKAQAELEKELITAFMSFKQADWKALDAILSTRFKDTWNKNNVQSIFATNKPVSEIENALEDTQPTVTLYIPDNGRKQE